MIDIVMNRLIDDLFPCNDCKNYGTQNCIISLPKNSINWNGFQVSAHAYCNRR